MTTEDRRIRLFNKILNKPDYRKSFVEEHVYTGIPFQVHALRTHEGWTQTELGNKAGMAQTRISKIENQCDGELNNISTLLKIAHAFHVGLLVRFVPISEILEREMSTTPESLKPIAFEDDPYFQTLEGEKEKVVIGKSLISGNVIDLGKYRAEKTWETEKPLMPDLTTNQSTREIFVAHT